MNKNFLAIEKDIHDFAQELYLETEARKKSRNLSKQWLELKQNLLKMDINRIKEIEKSSKTMS